MKYLQPVEFNPLPKKRNEHNKKLTDNQVREIRLSSEHPLELAKKYNVSRSCIEGVKNRTNYKNVL
jgi:hypothetical protein